MQKLVKWFKHYSLLTIICELLLIILSVVTIFCYQQRIILEVSVILVINIFLLFLLFIFNLVTFSYYQIDFKNPRIYLNLDTFVILIALIVCYGLISFKFNILIMLIVYVLAFIYHACVYQIKNTLWQGVSYDQKD